MRRFRLSFNYDAFWQCKKDVDAIRSDQYVKALLGKDMVSFWKHINKSNNTRVLLANTIGLDTGENKIAEVWQDHYKSILNSVKPYELGMCGR